MATSTQSDTEQTRSGGGESTLAQELKEDGRQRIDSTRRAAAQHIEGVADAIDAAGSSLDNTQPTLAAYTANLADSIERAASRLRDSTLEELARDARQFASRNPGLFVLGSAAAGIVLARFVKVMAEESGSSSHTTYSKIVSDSSQSDPATAGYQSATGGEPAAGSSSGFQPH